MKELLFEINNPNCHSREKTKAFVVILILKREGGISAENSSKRTGVKECLLP